MEYLCLNPTLPADATIPFGRDHADKLAEFLGFDVRNLTPYQRLQFSRLGGDPTEVYFLPDGRVVVDRSRQFYRVSQIAILPNVEAWTKWRREYSESY